MDSLVSPNFPSSSSHMWTVSDMGQHPPPFLSLQKQHISLPSSVGRSLSSFNGKEAQVSSMKHFPSSSVRNLLVLERACHFMGKRNLFKNKPSLNCFLIQLCWLWVARQHRFSCDRKINVLNSSNNNKTPKFLKALCLSE